MGAADMVPGVSGGTVAFITGIYEELIDSISAFNVDAFQLLKAGRLPEFWKHINGTFLLVLLSGIGTSLIVLAKLIIYLLNTYSIPLWSFFFGLIVISSVLVLKEIKTWKPRVIIAGLAGIAIAYTVTVLSPAQTPEALWFIFICGALAICAMILPGISGAFILLLLVKYEYIVSALTNFNLPVILVFGTGCVVGLLSFSRVVSWLLDKFYNTAVALLAGFMIGSLNKVWPWKVVKEYYINSHGEQKPLVTQSVSPAAYAEATGLAPEVLLALLFAMVGILMVVILEKISHHKVSPN
jgi:putative membrane protein